MTNYRTEYADALKEINFKFWKQVSEGSLDNKIGNSSSNMLKKIQETEVNSKHLLADIEQKPSKELADFTKREFENLIKKKINDFDVNKPDFDKHDYKKLGDIFDLIHVWGGWTGRHPYVNSKSRLCFDKWQDVYLKGAELAQKNDQPKKALEKFEEIEGIRTSYASKHLRFWSNEYPVVDARISLILRGVKTPTYKNYRKILLLLKDLRKLWDCCPIKAENIVYTFSAYYFLNDKLEFNDAPKPKCCDVLKGQQKIAQEIIDIYKRHHPKK